MPVRKPHSPQSRAAMGGSTNCMGDLCQAMLWRTRLHLVRRSRGCALVMDVPFTMGGSSATGQHAEHCLMHPFRPPGIVYYAGRDVNNSRVRI